MIDAAKVYIVLNTTTTTTTTKGDIVSTSESVLYHGNFLNTQGLFFEDEEGEEEDRDEQLDGHEHEAAFAPQSHIHHEAPFDDEYHDPNAEHKFGLGLYHAQQPVAFTPVRHSELGKFSRDHTNANDHLPIQHEQHEQQHNEPPVAHIMTHHHEEEEDQSPLPPLFKYNNEQFSVHRREQDEEEERTPAHRPAHVLRSEDHREASYEHSDIGRRRHDERFVDTSSSSSSSHESANEHNSLVTKTQHSDDDTWTPFAPHSSHFASPNERRANFGYQLEAHTESPPPPPAPASIHPGYFSSSSVTHSHQLPLLDSLRRSQRPVVHHVFGDNSEERQPLPVAVAHDILRERSPPVLPRPPPVSSDAVLRRSSSDYHHQEIANVYRERDSDNVQRQHRPTTTIRSEPSYAYVEKSISSDRRPLHEYLPTNRANSNVFGKREYGHNEQAKFTPNRERFQISAESVPRSSYSARDNEQQQQQQQQQQPRPSSRRTQPPSLEYISSPRDESSQLKRFSPPTSNAYHSYASTSEDEKVYIKLPTTIPTLPSTTAPTQQSTAQPYAKTEPSTQAPLSERHQQQQQQRRFEQMSRSDLDDGGGESDRVESGRERPRLVDDSHRLASNDVRPRHPLVVSTIVSRRPTSTHNDDNAAAARDREKSTTSRHRDAHPCPHKHRLATRPLDEQQRVSQSSSSSSRVRFDPSSSAMFIKFVCCDECCPASKSRVATSSSSSSWAENGGKEPRQFYYSNRHLPPPAPPTPPAKSEVESTSNHQSSNQPSSAKYEPRLAAKDEEEKEEPRPQPRANKYSPKSTTRPPPKHSDHRHKPNGVPCHKDMGPRPRSDHQPHKHYQSPISSSSSSSSRDKKAHTRRDLYHCGYYRAYLSEPVTDRAHQSTSTNHQSSSKAKYELRHQKDRDAETRPRLAMDKEEKEEPRPQPRANKYSPKSTTRPPPKPSDLRHKPNGATCHKDMLWFSDMRHKTQPTPRPRPRSEYQPHRRYQSPISSSSSSSSRDKKAHTRRDMYHDGYYRAYLSEPVTGRAHQPTSTNHKSSNQPSSSKYEVRHQNSRLAKDEEEKEKPRPQSRAASHSRPPANKYSPKSTTRPRKSSSYHDRFYYIMPPPFRFEMVSDRLRSVQRAGHASPPKSEPRHCAIQSKSKSSSTPRHDPFKKRQPSLKPRPPCLSTPHTPFDKQRKPKETRPAKRPPTSQTMQPYFVHVKKHSPPSHPPTQPTPQRPPLPRAPPPPPPPPPRPQPSHQVRSPHIQPPPPPKFSLPIDNVGEENHHFELGIPFAVKEPQHEALVYRHHGGLFFPEMPRIYQRSYNKLYPMPNINNYNQSKYKADRSAYNPRKFDPAHLRVLRTHLQD